MELTVRSMNDVTIAVTRSRRGGAARLSLLLGVALSLSISTAIITTPVHAETRRTVEQAPQAESEEAPVPASVATPIRLANQALAQAKLRVANRQLGQAITSLQTVRVNTRRAHIAAMNLIGKPPTDPESDDPPGPPAVMAVLGLEHRVGIVVVPFFDGRKGTTFVHALRYTLYVTHTTRVTMLNRVIGLDPEGAGGDYADGMADTLGAYSTEVNQIKKALDQYQLSSYGREGLRNALTRVRATQVKVNAAFGGGEYARPKSR
jgi:hypothetical protein